MNKLCRISPLSLLSLISLSFRHKRRKGGGGGELFNFLPIKKGEGGNLVPRSLVGDKRPGYDIKGGLIRDDGS